MANTLEQFVLEDGETKIYVESTPVPPAKGYRLVSRADGDAPLRLREAMARIKPVADELLTQFKELASQPDGVDVRFGVQLSGSLGAFVASSTMGANFSVRLRWRKAKPKKAAKTSGSQTA